MSDQDLKRFVLKAALWHGEAPMPEEALLDAMALRFRTGTRTQHKAFLSRMEGEGYLAGVSDDILGRSWSLTLTGKAKAEQLP